ncbi:MAG: phosphate ABC transporter permease PstA [Ignavibacteria bacterium]|jgi:phosphate transport system permease protein|nr:phosphate ABC transporter permease PstA [Ignavibacteria bacterium]MCU7504219.1 phosphate ABC transporter permease PstA [Ignavibacteria bacterium]MCU7516064.1 phosphate ABC transporter permease PstA [Ignavibacteria bacterium]
MTGKLNSNLRKFKSLIMTLFSIVCALVVIVPLFIILFYTLKQGVSSISWSFFTEMPKPAGELGGGMANALMGTAILIGLGSLIGIPVGLFSGIYLSEGNSSLFARSVRFLTEVLNGIPSIVIGVVAYILIVIPMRRFSALAGGFALGILMIPLITRTTEEMLRLVPESYREGALALGAPRWKATLFVVLPAAFKGIFTGILLSIARAAGETAPLLFTALGNRFWSTRLDEPIASLTVFIYDYSRAPFEDWNRQAWAAALVLILLVTLINVTFRIFTREKTP